MRHGGDPFAFAIFFHLIIYVFLPLSLSSLSFIVSPYTILFIENGRFFYERQINGRFSNSINEWPNLYVGLVEFPNLSFFFLFFILVAFLLSVFPKA